MGPLGAQEMIAIFIIALLLFGPKKLPELGRMLGKALSEFRRAKNELRNTFETHMRELERESQSQSQDTPANTGYSVPEYPYRYHEYGRYEPDSQSSSSSLETGTTATEQPDPERGYSHPETPRVTGTVPRSNATEERTRV